MCAYSLTEVFRCSFVFSKKRSVCLHACLLIGNSGGQSFLSRGAYPVQRLCCGKEICPAFPIAGSKSPWTLTFLLKLCRSYSSDSPTPSPYLPSYHPFPPHLTDPIYLPSLLPLPFLLPLSFELSGSAPNPLKVAFIFSFSLTCFSFFARAFSLSAWVL